MTSASAGKKDSALYMLRLKEFALRVLGWAFGRGPGCYGGTYFVLMLILFPCVYCWYPTEFYHSTVMHEAAVRADAEKILKGVREGIIRHCKPPGQSLEDGWVMDVKNVELSGIRYDQGRVSFRLAVKMEHESGHASVRAYTYCSITPGEYGELLGGDHLVLVEFSPDKYDRQPAFDFDCLFPAGFERPRGQRFLAVSRQVEERISDYTGAHEGRPGRTSGGLLTRFLRRLYLSVVTQTTLGYGDIVPITTRTRVLVTSQSVIGIVLIGLFLNAIGSKVVGARSRNA